MDHKLPIERNTIRSLAGDCCAGLTLTDTLIPQRPATQHTADGSKDVEPGKLEMRQSYVQVPTDCTIVVDSFREICVPLVDPKLI